ncbi:hypothetical protein L218DRAFT_882187 [Marasmius fiardii PR-910]|nr:hypothetical protein L218DRAFT_882187 [Marasmius fiardii PR-910]
MLRCSQRSGLYPQGLMIENVQTLGNSPLSSSGFGDVYKGKIGGLEQIVALKIMRSDSPDENKLLKDFMREAIVWQQLKHPNVLPFIGMCYLSPHTQQQLTLISPWMEGGNLTRFLKITPREQVDHLSLVLVNSFFF